VQEVRRARRFLRFCVVGTAGFLTDASVLLALVCRYGLDPILARVFSFAVAVLVTFELNRAWTFGAYGQPRLAAFASYIAVQGLALACNGAIYTFVILMLPLPYNAPLFALAVASGLSLTINYLGIGHLVFDPPQAGPHHFCTGLARHEDTSSEKILP
jgi:putative flippase GtrA